MSFSAWRADASAVIQSVDGYNKPEPELTIEEKVSALEKESVALRETFTEKGLITKSEIETKISGARK